MNKVFVVGGDASVRLMFHEEGWANVFSPSDADYICFTGGEDVSPELYGQVNEGLSRTNPDRDKREVALFKEFADKKFIGICRGAQLLNVLCGGSMIQDIDGHLGSRRSVDTLEGTFPLLEDHHQAMIPGVGATILGMDSEDKNYEILVYKTKENPVFCFQAHPEWVSATTKRVFFKLMEGVFS